MPDGEGGLWRRAETEGGGGGGVWGSWECRGGSVFTTRRLLRD